MDDELTPQEERLLEELREWLPAFRRLDEEDHLVVPQEESAPPRALARTMIRPLRRALEEQDHRFPSFSALLKALRFALGSADEVARRLDVPRSLLTSFERGAIHPAWFPRSAVLGASRLVASPSEWEAAIAEARTQEAPAARPPSPEERQLIADPWLEADGSGEVAEQAKTSVAQPSRTESVEELSEGEWVRWVVTGEDGLIRRKITGDVFEVAFPSGQRYLSARELVAREESLAARLARRRPGHAPLFAHRLRALYLQYAYRNDELAGLTNSRIEPQPHQIYVAWRVLQKVRPRMILADEVGLGKTIETGIILKELEARDLVERALFVVPASLVSQWVYEFRSKFNIELEIFDGPRVRDLKRKHPDTNVWSLYNWIVCSLPFASRESVAEEIAQADPWDIVVFDEAHRVRRQPGRSTQAYRLANRLRFDTYGMLLLSATPMQLDSYELFSLIELIEPGLFQNGPREFERKRKNVRQLNDLMTLLDAFPRLPQPARREGVAGHLALLRRFLAPGVKSVDEAAQRLLDPSWRSEAERKLLAAHPLTEVMVRNRKIQVLETFAPRDVDSIGVKLTPLEREAYLQVTEYVQEGFDRAQHNRNMAVGFLMVTFQKMLTSSSYALARSLERRIQRLASTLKHEAPSPSERPLLVGAPTRRRGRGGWTAAREAELKDAEELSEAIDEVLGAILSDEETRSEIEELRALVNLLDGVQDSKLAALRAFLVETFTQDPNERVIVFTQFVETQLLLKQALEAEYNIHIFNGRQKPDEKDRSVKRFREHGQILISTEAGGEGRNFQFAHIVVNYDLPWNPMRIEQRIGRVDRIGQERTVVVRNLFLRDTLDEKVFDVLRSRIKVFEESIGSLDPILGDVEDEIRRVALEVPVEEQAEEFDRLGQEIEQRIEAARQMEQRLQDFIIDRNSLRRDRVNELQKRKPLADQADLRRFVHDVVGYHGGSVDEHRLGGEVVAIPMRLGQRLKVRENRVRGTFDYRKALEMEELPFFAMGHPLVEKLLTFALAGGSDAEITAYEEEGDEEAWFIDLFYHVAARGIRDQEHFRRHRLNPSGLIASDRLTSMPTVGEEVDGHETPFSGAEIHGMVQASEGALASEIESFRREAQAANEGFRVRELERADRIYRYRLQKEEGTIAAQTELLVRIEQGGTSDERRLIPAIHGRIAKARERMERVELDFQEEKTSIEGRARVGVSYEPVGAAFVHMRPR